MGSNSDFVIENGVLKEYHGPGGDVVIPEGVTEIGELAFFSCRGLTSVTIPDGVTEIGGGTFADCTGLTSVTIPAGVTEISGSAFETCKKLTIHAPAGSCAEQYAKRYNIPFVAE